MNNELLNRLPKEMCDIISEYISPSQNYWKNLFTYTVIPLLTTGVREVGAFEYSMGMTDNISCSNCYNNGKLCDTCVNEPDMEIQLMYYSDYLEDINQLSILHGSKIGILRFLPYTIFGAIFPTNGNTYNGNLMLDTHYQPLQSNLRYEIIMRKLSHYKW
jgi:hypothetical protein